MSSETRRRAGLWAMLACVLPIGVAIAAEEPSDASSCELPPASGASPARGTHLGGTGAALDAARSAVDGEGDPTESLAAARAALARAAWQSAAEADRARVHLGRTLDLRAQQLRREAKGASRAIREIEREAVALFREVLRDPTTQDGSAWRSYAWGYQAGLYARQGRAQDALVLSDRAIAIAVADGDQDALARWQAQRGDLLRRLDRAADALDAYRSARAAHEEIRPGLDAATFLARAREPYSELADLLLVASSHATGGGQSLLREAQDVLEDLKTAELRDYFDDPCLAEQRSIDARALPDTIVLYPVLLRDRFDLLVGTEQGLERIALAADPADVRREVHRFVAQVQDPTSMRYRRAGEQLYRWLISPLESRLGPGKTLVLVPSGPFLQLPIAALRDPESGRFVIERVAVAVSPGLRLTEPRPIDRARTRALIAGVSEAARGFPALPGVPAEMRAVADAFPGMRIVDGQFTMAAFERAFDAEPYGIVHISSHGEYSAESSESFLLAWDGLLTLDRFAEIVSRARFRHDRPLELLSLSACETARGDDRAVLGLAGLAIRSGARSALGTLWQVSDVATGRLVEVFYRELSKPGVSRGVALQRAQIDLLRSDAFGHPSFWAPFLIVSSWL